jgi:hypothetical protein
MAGNRTRVDCLEGNHANLYTTIACYALKSSRIIHLKLIKIYPPLYSPILRVFTNTICNCPSCTILLKQHPHAEIAQLGER